jgi:hypothetical protein
MGKNAYAFNTVPRKLTVQVQLSHAAVMQLGVSFVLSDMVHTQSFVLFNASLSVIT